MEVSMHLKKLTAFILSTALLFCGLSQSVPVSALDEQYRPPLCSEDYMTSQYYQKLWKARQENASAYIMDKTLAVAMSQVGYKNYATDGVDIDLARQQGKIWTGNCLRMNWNITGNTEYTRWIQSYVLGGKGGSVYLDLDWCAIFASWCLYQAG